MALGNKIAALAIVLSSLFATPVLADEVIAEYLAWLDARDTVNSSGVKLGSFGQVLAQDRANYHRFGIRQELDMGDTVFGSRDMRAKLPKLYEAGRRVEAYILEDVMSGRGHYVLVRVMGQGGRVTRVDVYEGAG
ncbi:hypothetical protein [Hoeflea sp.]|uniref:hypothetical protein n=1 Tax=Hoeflea sp. TaxID=1940281 RepID=UPI003B5236A2